MHLRLDLAKSFAIRKLTFRHFLFVIGFLLILKIVSYERKFEARILENVTFKLPLCQCHRTIPIRFKSTNETFNWCNEETSWRGNNQSVLGFSLYGDFIVNGNVSRYYTVITTVPKEIKQYYPGWRMRIYHGIRPNQIHERDVLCNVYCNNDNVDLCDVNEIIESLAVRKTKNRSLPILSSDLSKVNRMNWRLLPLIDPTVDRYMSRDVDSQVNPREVAAVNQWLQSDYTFHVMRDHWAHIMPIMGGMFGVKVSKKRHLVEGLTKVMFNFGTAEGYNLDQTLLQKIFWPSVKDDAVIHDSYLCEKDWNSLPITPYPTQRDPILKLFVSERVGAHVKPGTCPVACRPPNHKDWEFC